VATAQRAASVVDCSLANDLTRQTGVKITAPNPLLFPPTRRRLRKVIQPSHSLPNMFPLSTRNPENLQLHDLGDEKLYHQRINVTRHPRYFS
jgi:hypothetical protein